MIIKKGFVVIFRIIMLATVIWFSYATMLAFEMLFHTEMTVNFVLLALLISAIFLVIIALDLVLNTKLKKQDSDGYNTFSKILNAASFMVLLVPIVYVTVCGGFLELFVAIAPAVGMIASFADFARLLWIRED